MQTIHAAHRSSLIASAARGFDALRSCPQRAHAVSKEMIQLQTQVQQLLDMVQRLQTTMDTRFAVLQNLAQQTADQATQMSATVNALQQKLAHAERCAERQAGHQFRAGAVAERLSGRAEDAHREAGQVDPGPADTDRRTCRRSLRPRSRADKLVRRPWALQDREAHALCPRPVAQAPPLDQTYQAAVSDFNAAKYQLASSEFQDVIHYYPLDPMAGNAQFYLGEIAYRQKNYDDAMKDYNVVLEQYSGSPKAAAAQLHKGMALIETGKRDAGIHELRSLIQRHPQTPEAATGAGQAEWDGRADQPPVTRLMGRKKSLAFAGLFYCARGRESSICEAAISARTKALDAAQESGRRRQR